MESLVLGYIGALLVGVTLGLIGGGGSIITVPVLVYVLHLNPITATAYSLFVVGTSSFVGTIKNIKDKRIDYRAAFTFAIPALIVVYLTRKFLVPAIPDIVFTLGSFDVTRHIFIMVLFSIIMVLASLSMIKDMSYDCAHQQKRNPKLPVILFQAVGLGLVTGIVGAGGGFLIVPALVLLLCLPMKKAVATSLLIITLNSLIGFLGDLNIIAIDWNFLITFTAFSVVGIFLGIYISRFIEGKKLKKGFGWFVLIMGLYIVIREIFL